MKPIFSLMLKTYLNSRRILSCYFSEMMNWLSFFSEKKGVISIDSNGWWSEGVFVIGLFLLLLALTASVYKQVLKSFSMKSGIKPIQQQYLFYTQLPATLYKVSCLNCLGIMMDDLLFNERGIYVIQKLKGEGVLSGEVGSWCLKLILPALSIEKTIKNPISILEAKVSFLRELLGFYEINLIVDGYYIYNEQQLYLQLSSAAQKLNFIKEQELPCFLKQLSTREISNKTFNDNQVECILLFIISMRYVEYLREFYKALSLVDKVNLSSTLSQCSKELLGFFVSSASSRVEKMYQFKRRYLDTQSERMYQLQAKLFYELEQWALQHPDLEFMCFNEEALTFSEGFQLSHLKLKKSFPVLHNS